MRSIIRLFAVAAAFVSLNLAPAFAADEAKPVAELREQAINRAVDFLRTHGQAKDGSYSSAAGPAVSALVNTALLRCGRSPDDPMIASGLKYISSFVQPDGGIYQPGTNYKNYETCLAIVCFERANRGGKYDTLLAAADRFVKGIQWDESESHDRTSVNYGGAGYGKSKRPDLSNTSFLMDALKATGTGADDEAMKKALIFVSRCQNLESEHNTTEFPAKNNDGGFYYTPAGGGSSQAGKTESGGLRSYASMTYAGLKSMIYAGVGPDDPRVQAALTWLKKNYSLESNPGMGDAGLFYYYTTFAKALDALGQETFVDEQGKPHQWRDELARELAARQRADGSWLNDNARWMEGDPNLVTAYGLLALSYCQQPAASTSR